VFELAEVSKCHTQLVELEKELTDAKSACSGVDEENTKYHSILDEYKQLMEKYQTNYKDWYPSFVEW